ncbi:hypothetical protein D5086_000534 [Populus alba]|uniref:Uncharacterized protein n=1 Tax=Populus alba TaxID=43335 RepID=A0ACC4CWV8_POPAL
MEEEKKYKYAKQHRRGRKLKLTESPFGGCKRKEVASDLSWALDSLNGAQLSKSIYTFAYAYVGGLTSHATIA